MFLITAPSLYPSQTVRTLLDFIKDSFSEEGVVGKVMKGQFGGSV